MNTLTVKYATTINLNATQINLNLVALNNGVLVIDGNTPSINEIIVVKDQTDLTQNGIYKVVNLGSASGPYILTRDTDILRNSLGQIFYVLEGDLNNHLSWYTSSPDEIFTCGMSPLIFNPFGQYTSINDTLEGLGTPDSLLSVNINNKSTNKIMTNQNGLCVEHVSTDTIIGEGTTVSPYKVLVSEDTDNIIAYGSDGGILARVNITNTTQMVSAEFNGFTTTVSTDIRYNLRGQVITMEIDTFSGTSNLTTLSASAVIPYHLRPSDNLKKDAYITDNGTEQKGTVILNSNGNINIFVGVNTAFNPGGNKGLSYFSCSYLKN